MQNKRKAPTGHLTVEDRKSGRVWVAKHNNTPTGERTRKVLGPAWVKPNGKTPRGATKWRTAAGSKPDGYLSPPEAEAELASLLHTKPEQRATVHAGTFGEACAAYLKRAERDREASTFRGYRGYVNTHLLPRLGKRTPLASITSKSVAKLREDMLNAGLAPRTVRQAQVILSGIFAQAVEADPPLIEQNPCKGVKMATVKDSGDFNVLTPEEVEAVARAASNEFYAALFRFAAHSGLRMGELRALRWEDVRFADESILVRLNAPTSAPVGTAEKLPKSGKVRPVPLTPVAAAALDRLSRRELFNAPQDRVFPAPLGGPFNDDEVRDEFYRALTAAGLGHMREREQPIRFHDLRHTFGTLAARVAQPVELQAWMGHADIKTTMKYAHHVPQHDAAARLGRAFEVAATPGAVTV